MMRRIAITIAFAMMGVCLSCDRSTHGVTGAAGVPVWHVGDSWVVRCPFQRNWLKWSPEPPPDYFRVSCHVIGLARVNERKCYVLDVRPVGKNPVLQAAGYSYETKGYYALSDLSLLRVDVYERKKGKLGRKLVGRTYSTGKQPIQYNTVSQMPMQLPMFPIHVGQERLTASVYKEYGEVWSPYKSVTEQYIEKCEQTHSEPGERNAGKAVRITFLVKAIVEYKDKTVARKNPVMVQIWVPGMPWWMSLECGRYKWTLEAGASGSKSKSKSKSMSTDD